LRKFADLFYAHQGRLVDKWEHYFPIYDKHFAKYQDKPVNVLEIGVSHGGSLQIWAKYFGRQASIWGLDIDPRCSDYEEDGINITIADQSNPGHLAWYKEAGIEFDIVIDDGSHAKEHQSTSLQALWPHTKGVYLIEDCHEGAPSLPAPGAIVITYPWVVVLERPKRLIRGNPSREMRQDEVDAFNLYSDV
jgi:cephalosporin hydroxylase